MNTSPSLAALRAATLLNGGDATGDTTLEWAAIIDAEFAAERAHTAHNMIADVTPIVFKLEQERAELIEALRDVMRATNTFEVAGHSC